MKLAIWRCANLILGRILTQENIPINRTLDIGLGRTWNFPNQDEERQHLLLFTPGGYQCYHNEH